MWWRRTDLAYRIDTSGLDAYAVNMTNGSRRATDTLFDAASFVVLALAAIGAAGHDRQATAPGIDLPRRRRPPRSPPCRSSSSATPGTAYRPSRSWPCWPRSRSVLSSPSSVRRGLNPHGTHDRPTRPMTERATGRLLGYFAALVVAGLLVYAVVVASGGLRDAAHQLRHTCARVARAGALPRDGHLRADRRDAAHVRAETIATSVGRRPREWAWSCGGWAACFPRRRPRASRWRSRSSGAGASVASTRSRSSSSRGGSSSGRSCSPPPPPRCSSRSPRTRIPTTPRASSSPRGSSPPSRSGRCRSRAGPSSASSSPTRSGACPTGRR